MTATADVTIAPQLYQIFIRTSPEALWQAITEPAFTARYFHGAGIGREGDDRWVLHGPDGSIWGDEGLIEWDAPRRLVAGWRSLYSPEFASEPSSRVMWEIIETTPGVCKLTVLHDRLESSPKTAANVSGAGWMHVLSTLRSFLETGQSL